MQILTNYQNQGTGQLSAMSVLLVSFRSFGRLFTNVAETGDVIRIMTYSSASLCNVVLFLQVYYYRKPHQGKPLEGDPHEGKTPEGQTWDDYEEKQVLLRSSSSSGGTPVEPVST